MNPNCREIEALLSPYLDGEVDETSARRVEEHVAKCPACRDALAAMREAERVLATAMPLRSQAEWESLAMRVEMAIDREEARTFREEAAHEMAPSMMTASRSSARPSASQRDEAPRRKHGLGWWLYGSGAFATAMLVLLLWPSLSERFDEGPPILTMPTEPKSDVTLEKSAPPALMDQEQLSVQEPASPEGVQEEIQSNTTERTGTKESARMERETKADQSVAQRPAQLDEAKKAAAPAPETAMRENFSAEKDSDKRAASDEPVASDKRAAAQSAPETGDAAGSESMGNASKAAPSEERSSLKERVSIPQPKMQKSEPTNSWRSDGGADIGRLKAKSRSGPAASDTPPPPTVKHFSETEWAEMNELQTQEALKVGTEKALVEATHVLESFLKEYPRSVFGPPMVANLVRTTSSLVQLNPNIYCERAVAALETWKLEQPPPAINLDAEITAIEGRCLK